MLNVYSTKLICYAQHTYTRITSISIRLSTYLSENSVYSKKKKKKRNIDDEHKNFSIHVQRTNGVVVREKRREKRNEKVIIDFCKTRKTIAVSHAFTFHTHTNSVYCVQCTQSYTFILAHERLTYKMILCMHFPLYFAARRADNVLKSIYIYLSTHFIFILHSTLYIKRQQMELNFSWRQPQTTCIPHTCFNPKSKSICTFIIIFDLFSWFLLFQFGFITCAMCIVQYPYANAIDEQKNKFWFFRPKSAQLHTDLSLPEGF